MPKRKTLDERMAEYRGPKERQSKYMTFSHIERARKNSDSLVAVFNRVKDDNYRIAHPHFRNKPHLVYVYTNNLGSSIADCKKIGIIPDEYKKAQIALAEYTPPPR